jgi:hypothetical protein
LKIRRLLKCDFIEDKSPIAYVSEEEFKNRKTALTLIHQLESAASQLEFVQREHFLLENCVLVDVPDPGANMNLARNLLRLADVLIIVVNDFNYETQFDFSEYAGEIAIAFRSSSTNISANDLFPMVAAVLISISEDSGLRQMPKTLLLSDPNWNPSVFSFATWNQLEFRNYLLSAIKNKHFVKAKRLFNLANLINDHGITVQRYCRISKISQHFKN